MLASLTSWLTPSPLFLILNVVIGTILLCSRLTSSRRPPYHDHHPGPDYAAPLLARAPSLLQRVKSFDFSFYKCDHSYHEAHLVHPSEPQYTAPPPLERTPSFLERVRSMNFYNFAGSHLESDYVSHPDPQCEVPQPDSPQLSRTPSFLERVTSFYRSNSIKANPETEFPPEPETDSGTDMIREHGPVHRSNSEGQVTQRRLPEKIKKSASENSRHKEDDEEVERRRPETARIEKKASFGESGDVDAKADDFINRFKQQLKLQRLDSLLRYKEMLTGK